jgi:FkbM family methyltransferase
MKTVVKITKKASILEKTEVRILRKLLLKRSQIHLQSYPVPMAVVAFDFIGNEIAINGMYELDELEGVFELLKGFKSEFMHGTACDVGANIGNHSRYFANKFNKVVAFEPNPLITDVLKFNTKFFPNISVFEYAIGNYEGTTKIFGNKLNIGGFSALPSRIVSNQEYADNNFDSSSIRVISLDSMQEHLPNLQFIKIDVEGFEMQVIESAAQIILKFRPTIAFEQWPTDFVNSQSKVIKSLSEMGYVFYWQTSYSSSSGKIIKSIYKFIQTMLGIKILFFNISNIVPPGHYSLLIAVHKSKVSKIQIN